MAVNSEPVHPPLYVKLSLIVLGMLAFFYILYIGRVIIVPIVFATLIAILLNPVVNFFCKIGINRILSITIAVLLTLALVTGFIHSLPGKRKALAILFLNWKVVLICFTMKVSPG